MAIHVAKTRCTGKHHNDDNYDIAIEKERRLNNKFQLLFISIEKMICLDIISFMFLFSPIFSS